MGNIRQIQIKNIARLFLEKYGEIFLVNDFNYNKKMVSKLTDNKSKKIRNRIAGYITKILSPNKQRGNVIIYE
jgi:small subunit ribosomal protein S17e